VKKLAILFLTRYLCLTIVLFDDARGVLKCFCNLQMDELACFVPGMLALGSSGYDPEKAGKFLTLAEEVSFF